MSAALAYLKEFNFLSAVVRLILAMACGSVVGFGRSKKKQNAGLRTYVLIHRRGHVGTARLLRI